MSTAPLMSTDDPLDKQGLACSEEPFSEGSSSVTDSDTVSSIEPPNVSMVEVEASVDEKMPAPVVEDGMSEEELRRRYDDEEIDRFLAFFADYVSEVVFTPTDSGTATGYSTYVTVQEGDGDDSEQCTPPKSELDSVSGGQLNNDTYAQVLATKYILPRLPPARPRLNKFSVGRLRITLQRAYLVAYPAYAPFFSGIIKLAAWNDRKESLAYCTVFWTAWYYNMLFPLLASRVLYALLFRRFWPHPTVQQLRERREEAARAEELGESINTRLGKSSDISFIEVWRMMQVFGKSKTTSKAKGKEAKSVSKSKNKSKTASEPSAEAKERSAQDTALKVDVSEPEDSDAMLSILHTVNDLTDFHERVKNLFLWRHPAASKTCVAFLVFVVVLTSFLPANYIMKLASAILGFLFWHVVPVITSLSLSDRKRIPPLFHDIPTDAEYAMQLISQRITRGEDIRPRPPPRKPRKKKAKPADDSSSSKEKSKPVADDADRHKEVDWRKWGSRVVLAKTWAQRGNNAVKASTNEEDSDKEEDALQTEKFPTPASGDTSNFLAHHRTSPGVITLTTSTLFFTPITSLQPKMAIPLGDIRGVKKTGVMGGLSIRRVGGSGGEVAEELFRWVGGRDDLFARLIAYGNRKWLTV